MSDLTACDILMIPDQAMMDRAGELNKQIRENDPDSFALDARHTPHITTLQRYFHTDKLDDVFDAVEETLGETDPASLELEGVKIAHMDMAADPGAALAGLVVQPGPGVVEFQKSLIAAVDEFTSPNGDASAYVTTADEPDINQDTLTYVENYIPDHSGENFMAHVTVGLGKIDFLKELESKPFDAFSFHPAAFAVFQLGNNGTAQKELKRWNLGDGGAS